MYEFDIGGVTVTSFHVLRHTTATWVLSSAKGIRATAGLPRHSNAPTTPGIYAYVLATKGSCRQCRGPNVARDRSPLVTGRRSRIAKVWTHLRWDPRANRRRIQGVFTHGSEGGRWRSPQTGPRLGTELLEPRRSA